MDKYTATEQAFKHGYEKGYAKAKSEIVHCKDCINKRRYHYKPPVCYCLFHERVKSENGFCDMGVRKDKGKEEST